MRGGEPRRIFLGEARRAPRRGRPGALAYGGGQGPPLLPRGLPGRCGAGEKDRCGAGGKGQVRTGQKGRQVPHGGKGCAVRRWGKGQVRHGGKRVRGAARGKKAGRCGAGEKAGRCRTGEKGCAVRRWGKRAGAARVPAGPLSPGRKCRRGLPGRRRPPRGSRGGRGKRERGDFPFSPPLASPANVPGTRTAPVRRGPGMCGGGKAGAAGFPRRGMPRRGIGPQKRGGAGGGNPPPALSPFLFAAPLGRRRTFFGTFCGALPTHKSIGRVRTRRRCRRRDFAGRPPRCRPRGRWSGGCRQRGARPPR